jgi:hypothetical protein
VEKIEELRFRVSKISDEYLPEKVNKPNNIHEIILSPSLFLPDIQIDTVVDSETYTVLYVDAQKDTKFPVNKIYFPGWKYYIDRIPYKPEIIQSIPFFTISKGKHKIEIVFTDTPIRLLSNMLSIGAIIVYIWFYEQETAV